MSKSIIKLVAAAAVILLAAAVALAIYVYPRRTVKNISDMVPANGMLAGVRIKNLAPVWKECGETAFGRKFIEGNVSPIREMMKRDKRFGRDWKLLHSPMVPELFGRDCVLALYLPSDGKQPHWAAWGRVGYKTRLFDLALRLWGAVRPAKDRILKKGKAGGFSVTYIMGRGRGAPIASYLILGDLGIVTEGDGGEFWGNVNSLAPDKSASPGPLFQPPSGDGKGKEATGSIFADLQKLSEYGGTRLAARRGKGGGGEVLPAALWADAQQAAAEWSGVSGTFSISGNLLDGNFSVKEAKGGPAAGSRFRERKAASDPLAALMEQRGLFYLGAHFALPEVLKRFNRRRGVERVDFVRRKETVSFPAGYFSFSWLDDDASILVYQDNRGIINAAVSLLANDGDLARERIVRFLDLASGAKIRLAEKGGTETYMVKEPLGIKKLRRGGEVYYRLGLEDVLGGIYSPVIFMRGDRVVAGTSDSVIDDLGRSGKPAAAGWTGPAIASTVVRGGELARTAASLRQIILLASPFVEKRSSRKFISDADRILEILQLLAPLREGWLTATGGETGIGVRINAQFAGAESS